MKKLLLLLILPALMLTSCNDNAKKIIGVWRLQNSSDPTLNSVMTFNQGSYVENEFKTENIPNSDQIISGNYFVDGDNVTIEFKNQNFEFKINWLSPDKFSLISDKDNLIFARIDSQEDNWQANYNNSPASKTGDFMTTPPEAAAVSAAYPDQSDNSGNSQNGDSSHHDLCSWCNGSGRCPICNGSGRIKGADQVVIMCSDCGGYGVCKRCKGSGYEPQ